jgi:hypothetical protein
MMHIIQQTYSILMDGDGEDAPMLLVTGMVFGEAVWMRRSPGRR